MKKNLLFIFLSLWLPLFVTAQDNTNALNTADSVDVLVTLADKYIIETNFEKALDYSIKAVNLAHGSNLKNQEAEAYTSLANSYQMVEDQTNAEKYFKEALKLGKAHNNLYVLIAASNGLGNVYSQNSKTLDRALEYYEASTAYALKSKEPERIFIASLNTATLFLESQKANKAFYYIENAKKSYDNYQKTIPLYDVTLDYVQGIYYKQKQDNSKALLYLDKALNIAKAHDLVLDLIEIYKAKSEIYQKEGKFNLAIANLKHEQYYKDLNSNREKASQIEEINAKFKVKEYERELKASKKEKLILEALSVSNTKTITITIISIVMLLGVIALMFNSYKKKKTNYELKIRNEALEEAKNNAERLTLHKSKFISRVSHELRTPLYGVVGITSILQEDKSLIKKHGSLINSLKFSGDHLINLVNNVLKISQIESQDIQLNLTDTNLSSLLKNIINSFQFQAKQNNNRLVLDIRDNVHSVYKVDSVRLSEILINLIANAIKFTHNGEIIVSVSILENLKNKNRLCFEIKDTGKGILKDHQASVFDNFNQINEEENTYEGAGLGLPIVKHLLALMNSKIKLESRINEGSIFSFILELEFGEMLSSPKRTQNGFVPKRILIAEDNKLSQMVTRNLIKLIGHDCVIAENGLEAFERAKNERFDMVLMDLNMPEMNGYDATKEIRNIKPDLKIIALTATEISEVKQKCFDSGMVEVINKPLSKSELDHVINRYFLDDKSFIHKVKDNDFKNYNSKYVNHDVE